MLWLLLAPFVAVSLISATVMPVATAHGITMVICSSDGIAEILVDPKTGQPIETGEPSAHCDWAAVKTVATSTASPAVEAPPFSMAAIRPVLPTTMLSHARAAGLPPSTGPPSAI
ncbi:MAG: hypothetical protein AAGE18_00210 [Pseudomonadota bacterium]